MNKYLLYWNIEYNMLTREKLATILVLLFSASLQGCCKKYEHLNIKKNSLHLWITRRDTLQEIKHGLLGLPCLFSNDFVKMLRSNCVHLTVKSAKYIDFKDSKTQTVQGPWPSLDPICGTVCSPKQRCERKDKRRGSSKRSYQRPTTTPSLRKDHEASTILSTLW
jgi:hypothetical protein